MDADPKFYAAKEKVIKPMMRDTSEDDGLEERHAKKRAHKMAHALSEKLKKGID